MKNRKVDIFWELAFDKFNLEEQIEDYGSVEISTDEIKSISNPSTGQTFEPRLVTKFDSISDLPKIFKVGDTREVRYSIMSKSRRSYVIVKANLYKKLDAKFKFGADKLNRMSFPTHIKSIDEDSITSEANALNVALFSGIFDEFFNSSNFVQTISGRMGTGNWAYLIGDKLNASVENTQMEIDGSLENDKYLVLIEAKNKLNDDFLIRQLYFPYRCYYEKLKGTKCVVPIFLVYSMNVFTLIEYKFQDVNNILSVEKVKKMHYTFEKRMSRTETEKELKGCIIKPPTEPFPQADDLGKVIGTIEYIGQGLEDEIRTAEIAELFEFDKRQGAYYLAGARFLGLLDKDTNNLTEEGKFFLESDFKDKVILLLKTLYKSPSFRYAIDCLIFNKKEFEKDELIEIMKNLEYRSMSQETAKRRAGTIKSWVYYLLMFYI